MCANNIKLTIEQVRDNIYKINPNILIISNEYINANEKLVYVGETIEAIDINFCPMCGRDLRKPIGTK